MSDVRDVIRLSKEVEGIWEKLQQLKGGQAKAREERADVVAKIDSLDVRINDTRAMLDQKIGELRAAVSVMGSD